jgi:hypothetical protein
MSSFEDAMDHEMLKKRLEELVVFMRDHGITRLKTSGIEIEIAAKPADKPSQETQAQPGTMQEIEGEEPPSDEDLLYWSSGFEPERAKPTPGEEQPS